MGFKHVSFAPPLYCWAEPGHIYVEELDGTVSDYKSHIKVSIPKQCNQFQSPSARWALVTDDSYFIGNKYMTYSQIRRSDGVLLSYGGWFGERETVVSCGNYEGNALFVSKLDWRTIYASNIGKVFRLNKPCKDFDELTAAIDWEVFKTSFNLYIEGRHVVDGQDGTWISAAAPTRTDFTIPL